MMKTTMVNLRDHIIAMLASSTDAQSVMMELMVNVMIMSSKSECTNAKAMAAH